MSRLLKSILMSFALILSAPPEFSCAITITMEYTDEGDPTPHPENPAWDLDGTRLKAHFNRAKQIWEQLLPGPGDYEFDFHWDDDLGTNIFGSTTDEPLDTYVEINPLQNWYVDPSPLTDDEFSASAVQTLYGGLSATDKTTYFPGTAPPPALETLYLRPGIAGPVGVAGFHPVNGFDLLTTIVHEIGHILGIYGTEPGEYNILPEHVGGLSNVLVLEGDGGHLGGGPMPPSSQNLVPGFLMCNGCATQGVRRFPTATDVLVIAEDQGITDVFLARVGRISSGDWSTPSAWIGSDVPNSAQDAYISHGQTVTLSTDSAVKDLRVDGGSTFVIGDRIFSSTGKFNFVGPTSVSIASGGILYANEVVRGSNDLTTANGSSVVFNSYAGGASNSANFNGSVSIGSGGSTALEIGRAHV